MTGDESSENECPDEYSRKERMNRIDGTNGRYEREITLTQDQFEELVETGKVPLSLLGDGRNHYPMLKVENFEEVSER